MRAIALLAVALSLAPAAAAAAQTDDDAAAQAHFQVGASYYDMGDYEAALREFEIAFRLSERPQLNYNISLCLQQLGRLSEAAGALERYLDGVSDIPNRATLTTRLENLRARAARGETAVGDTETGASSDRPDETSLPTEPSEPVDTGGGGPNVGAIVGFSVAALGLVGAAVFGGLTIAEDSRLASGCGGARTCVPADVSGLSTFALVTDVSFGVALAGALVGTVLLLVGGTGGEAATAESALGLRLAPLAGGTFTGIALDGSF